jgi:hypothetical protein
MSQMSRIPIALVALLFTIAASASAQPSGYVVELSGPRFGVTYLSPGVVSRLERDAQISVSPIVTQFGWQTEKRYGSFADGTTPVTELVFLVGGIEQNQFLPSVTGLIGFRTPDGMEIGLGPNLTPVSASIAFAFGMTYRSGMLNVPVNLAVVPSNAGVRISVLSGFNLRSR